MTMDDDAIRALLRRLSRRHASGGEVVERAAIVAEGDESAAILTWISDHDGRPESAAPAPAAGGLHGGGLHGAGSRTARQTGTATPARYVLPAGALVASPDADQTTIIKQA